ncbi:MAG: hypothetical protein AB1403_17425 [Candidatus Riflebacteria bacterium]
MTQEEIKKLAEELKLAIAPEWMTEQQAADYLQVARSYIRKYRRELGAELLRGNKHGWRYNRKRCDAFLVNPF